ncbi:MAG TPA: nicotinate-nucleotide--dimethylbenzimidazole phosphoribosyltransferase [Bryobacteraceae bacterium]|nr:nicotinate-nucleotide--dimethylbenzimidazole phosphoribosyltransferase [Bryobacteraceae bacterium]
MTPESRLNSLIESIEPVDPAWVDRARARQLQLTKPPGSLGRLEEIANRLASIQGTLAPMASPSKIVLFAGDHGVCAEGVNPYPQAVTAQMVANFLRGGAAINALARVAGSDLQIVDAGVAFELPVTDGLICRAVARGTRNFCQEPAMTREQAIDAVLLGVEMVGKDYPVLGIGEMGIGNTTSASALTAVLTGLPAASVTGQGTGAGDDCMRRKISAVERGLALHGTLVSDPIDMLARLGGFEIAGMCGVCLGAAANKQAVVVDGFISTAAAAVATRIQPHVSDYLFAAHRSTEPGHVPLLEIIGQRPLLDLGMRLGEGTGAALAIPILRAAVEAFTKMATFESAGVSET